MSANRIHLSARVIEAQPLRYTPAGLPALDLVLEHHAEEQVWSQPPRVCQFQIKAQAFGTLAERLSRVDWSVQHAFEGFLSSGRTGKGVMLQIQNFNPIND